MIRAQSRRGYRCTRRGDPQDIGDALISTDHMWMESVHIAERKVAAAEDPTELREGLDALGLEFARATSQ